VSLLSRNARSVLQYAQCLRHYFWMRVRPVVARVNANATNTLSPCDTSDEPELGIVRHGGPPHMYADQRAQSARLYKGLASVMNSGCQCRGAHRTTR
jgi:hypothetical protein